MTITLKTIFCAVDLSERSKPALQRALRLAREHDAWLDVLHVVDREQPAPVLERQQEVAWNEIRGTITALDQARADKARITVLVDDPVNAIARCVRTHERGLLVLGSPRKRSGWRWPFSSHTAGRMLRAANGPVLVAVRDGGAPYHRVVVGVDWSLHSRRAVELAIQVAPGAEHRLLHAWQIPYEDLQPGERPRREYAELAEREMASFVEQDLAELISATRAAHPSFELVTSCRMGAPETALREVAASASPDLVVLGTRGHGGVKRAFLGSVAEDILSDPPCDVLVAVQN